MRKKEPFLPRPFKTPWVPLLPWLGVLVNVGLMAALGADTWAAFLIWMTLGLAIYFSYSRRTSRVQKAEAAKGA